MLRGSSRRLFAIFYAVIMAVCGGMSEALYGAVLPPEARPFMGMITPETPTTYQIYWQLGLEQWEDGVRAQRTFQQW
jgi:hypothetical protein